MATQGVLALATTLAIVYRGYYFGKQDQNLYLPFVLHWNAPSLFSKDMLLGLGYARQSLTWLSLSFLNRWISLEALCLVLYVACSYLVILLTFKTALLWWRDERAAWLAVALWIPTYWVPGVDNSTFDDYFTTRLLGTVFGMSLLYAALKGRSRAAGAFGFLGGVAHIISGAPVVAGVLLACAIQKKWRLAVWSAGGFIAAAILLLALGREGEAVPHFLARYTGEWLDTVLRADRELFPHLWPSSNWHALAAYVLPFFGLFFWRWRRGRSGEMEKEVFWVCAGILLCSLVGLAGSALHLILIVQFCLFRGVLFFMWLQALYLAGVLSSLLEDRRWPLVLGGAWVAGSWLSGQFDLMVLALPILALAWNWEMAKDWMRKKWTGPRRVFWLGVALAALVALGWSNTIAFYLFGLNIEEWFLGRGAYLTAVTFTALLLLFCWAGAFRRASTHALAVLSLLILVTVVVPPPAVAQYFWASPTARRIYGVRIAVAGVTSAARVQQRQEREGMCRLIRDQVPRECTVLVPPDWMDFRLLSLRSPYVTFKDGAPSEFSEPFAREWLRRVKRAGGFSPNPGIFLWNGVRDLTDLEIRTLAEDEAALGLRFIVTPKEYAFPLKARSGRFNLYEIPPPESPAAGDETGKRESVP